jgi:CRISPR-associated protein Csx17
MTHDLVLLGCVSSVLASYLKALAIHRLVNEQLDPVATSWWDGNGQFHLVSTADRPALTRFFAERYAPTPIVTPWNGGSGFYPGDQQAGIQAIAEGGGERFQRYREAIASSRAMLQTLGLGERPDDKAKKLRLLRHARAWLADAAVSWLDAAYVAGEEARYPAILGTGGNDGRLDFANNFMQRLAELFLASPPRGRTAARGPDVAERFEAAVFGEARRGVLQKAAVGQFAPALAGGTNMTAGVDTDGRVNPWDFILALEGALVFAGAAVRRLGMARQGSASFPFHVNPSPVGYGSSAAADRFEARCCELWLPLWPAAATFGEIAAFFGEGRLEVGRRRATSGLDVARALTTLGLDRGVDRFERLGVLKRNGLSYLAAWLGTVPVHYIPRVDLLRELDTWLASVEQLDQVRADLAAALRALQEAMFAVCRSDRPLTAVLAAVGALEHALAASPKTHERARPLRALSAAWHAEADDGSAEFAIASAVSSWDVRHRLEPVAGGRWSQTRPVWSDRDPLENVVAVARERLIVAEAGAVPFDGRPTVTATALRRLLTGAVDRSRLRDLVFGLVMLDGHIALRPPAAEDVADVDRVFCVLRAVTSPRFLQVDGRHPSPKTIVAILARLAAGDVTGALDLAARRLRASGLGLRAPVREVTTRRDVGALAAALVVPLPYGLEDRLIHHAVRPPAVTLAPREMTA